MQNCRSISGSVATNENSNKSTNYETATSNPKGEAMIRITAEPLDVGGIFQSIQSVDCGATVLFAGSTRRLTDGLETVDLSYECYSAMAEKVLEDLELRARQRWPITGCVIHHRVGLVAVGEASVVVAVSSAHRDAAFEAARWLIDSLKETAPIWKQEHWSDGRRQWIHPVHRTDHEININAGLSGT